MSRVLLVLATSGGGVGRHVAALARGLVAAGDGVSVAAPAGADGDFGFTAAGAVAVRLDLADRPRPLADLRAVLALRRLATSADLDVVHAHGLRAGAAAVLAVRVPAPRLPGGRRGGRPAVVVTVHNAPVGGGRVALVGGVLERVVARGADAVLAVSGDLVERMRARGARDVERALVPAPAGSWPPAGPDGPPSQDAAARDAVRAGLGVAEGEALLVTVARLAPQKGLETLADALALLRAGHPDLRLCAVVAGDGPLGPGLAADAARRGLPLTLLGRRDDVPALLAVADLAVLPSRWEGQSLAVQEALRAGCPLVATDVGGTAELTGNAATLVPAGDPGALAVAVAALLADPARRRALGERARRRAATLPTEADAVAQVRALYARLVGRRAGRRSGGGGPGD